MPPKEISLKTFVHVSDLHIGDIDPVSGDAVVSAAAGYSYQNFTWFDGLLGHHGRALKELAEFCAALTDEGEAFELLVSGDFTRCGSTSEISTAQQFFTATVDLNTPNGNFVGLELGTMPAASITGNHDHWGGRNGPVGGGPLAAHGLVPLSLPFVNVYPLANQRRLVLVGIDTDSKVNPWGSKRLFAQGSFQDQLVAVEQKLPKPEQGDIRVLVSHHSMAKTGWLLKMDKASKAAISAFLANQDFSIVLSGHTHEKLFSTLPVMGNNCSRMIEELTCGSTTQHDQVPYNWRTLIGKMPTRRWPANTLLVHRLISAPGATSWHTQAYIRGAGGFGTLGMPGLKVIPL